jgi:hypothetical protein
VTLVLDGAIYDRDEGGMIEAGEVQMGDTRVSGYSCRRDSDPP